MQGTLLSLHKSSCNLINDGNNLKRNTEFRCSNLIDNQKNRPYSQRAAQIHARLPSANLWVKMCTQGMDSQKRQKCQMRMVQMQPLTTLQVTIFYFFLFFENYVFLENIFTKWISHEINIDIYSFFLRLFLQPD